MKLTVKKISSIFVIPTKIPNNANTNKNRIKVEKKKTLIKTLFGAFLNASNIQALLLTNMELSNTPETTATPCLSPIQKKTTDMSISSAENSKVPLKTETLFFTSFIFTKFFWNPDYGKPKDDDCQQNAHQYQ